MIYETYTNSKPLVFSYPTSLVNFVLINQCASRILDTKHVVSKKVLHLTSLMRCAEQLILYIYMYLASEAEAIVEQRITYG